MGSLGQESDLQCLMRSLETVSDRQFVFAERDLWMGSSFVKVPRFVDGDAGEVDGAKDVGGWPMDFARGNAHPLQIVGEKS